LLVSSYTTITLRPASTVRRSFVGASHATSTLAIVSLA
jgi:hypothetical protein